MWHVTFSGVEVEGNVPLLVPDTSGMKGVGVRAFVTETTPGNEPSGRFMLQADTAPRGWPEHRSGWISLGSSAREVEEAILQIPGLGAADVRVNASLPSIGPIAWEITFSHRKLVSDGAGNDVSFVATGQSGNRKPVRVVRDQLAGGGTRVEASTVRDGNLAISGMYEVYLRGNNLKSVTIEADASAMAARKALVEGLGLPEATLVTRVGPLDDNLAYAWTITLPVGTNVWVNGKGERGLVVNASQLSGAEGAFVNTALGQTGAVALEGSFSMSFEGERWTSVSYNATDTKFAQTISLFATAGENVSVSSEGIVDQASDQGVIGRLWNVTFSALAAAGDVPEIKVDSSGLTGTNVQAYVNETSKGITADVQEIVIDGYGGTFAIFSGPANVSTNSSSNPSVIANFVGSSSVPWDATPSQLADAIFEATAQRVYVERSPLTSKNRSSGGYSWLILFAEKLGDNWGSVHLNRSGLVPDDDKLGGKYRRANLTPLRNSTADAIGGSFSLQFGQTCDNRASGVFCSAAKTPQLRFNSTASQIKAALERLPTILEATVTGDEGRAWHGTGKTAPNGFGVSSSGIRFRVALNDVALNASDSGVAEYWHRTWSPENASVEWSGDLVIGGDLPLIDVRVSEMLGLHPAGRAKEVKRGLSSEAGGVVALEVSQNAGHDYTKSGATYVYEPLLSVDGLVPDHGPIQGGTQVKGFVRKSTVSIMRALPL